mmetsp:Transcript_27769/g.41180  ORF Transcript_27769/g.41180 Transcript_27769/m.41180 type:complete len:268 (-) Transcript_27769:38-841(-)
MSSVLSLDIRDVDGDVVSIGHSSRNGITQINSVRKLKSRSDGKTGVVSNNVHTKSRSVTSSGSSNVSKSNYSQSLSLQFLSSKHCLILLNTLLSNSLRPKVLHMVDSIDNTSRSKKHSSDNKFLYSIGVSSGGVEYGDSQFGTTGNRNIVRSCPTSCDSTHSVHDLVFLEFVGTKKDSMCISYVFVSSCADIICFVFETLQSKWTDLIESLDGEFSRCVVFDVSIGLPLRAIILKFYIRLIRENSDVISEDSSLAANVRCADTSKHC